MKYEIPFRVVRTDALVWGDIKRSGDDAFSIFIQNLPDVNVNDRLQDLRYPEQVYVLQTLDKQNNQLVFRIKDKIVSQ